MMTTWPNESTARDSVVRAAQGLASSGLLFRGAHANLSARIDGDRMVMTRGGSIERLRTEDLAVLDLSGQILNGKMEPTMQEVIQMHAGVYRTRDTVGAVIHTHAPHVTAFGVAHQEIPLVYEPLLRFDVSEPVPVVPWAPRGSEESVSAILRLVETHPGLPAVIMANHGVLVFHQTPESTQTLLATLDEAAELVILAQSLGGAKPLPDQALEAVRQRMELFGSRQK